MPSLAYTLHYAFIKDFSLIHCTSVTSVFLEALLSLQRLIHHARPNILPVNLARSKSDSIEQLVISLAYTKLAFSSTTLPRILVARALYLCGTLHNTTCALALGVITLKICTFHQRMLEISDWLDSIHWWRRVRIWDDSIIISLQLRCSNLE